MCAVKWPRAILASQDPRLARSETAALSVDRRRSGAAKSRPRLPLCVGLRPPVPAGLVGGVEVLEALPGLGGQGGGALDAAAEAVGGGAEGELRVGSDAAGHRHAGEEHVAELAGAGVRAELRELALE